MLLNFYFTGQNALVILIVAGQQGGGIQTIWALGLAPVAVQAALDLFHLGLTCGLRCSAEGERRSSRLMRAQLLISMPAGQGIQ